MANGSVNGNKIISPFEIPCGGSAQVMLQLIGQTGIAGSPTDIMLVLDRSGSMLGQPFADLKTGANTFVDILDEATDGTVDGIIANGSRVGVVSFETNALVNQPLTSNANQVKTAINSLAIGGATNHEHAFQLAQQQLSASNPGSKKVIIMFTDGQTTAGGSADDDAAAARLAGTEIYVIGLGSVDVTSLNNWATDPDSEHVVITPDSSELERIFEEIGAAISVPAGTDIQLVDVVNSEFSVSNVNASKGMATASGNTIIWTIDELQTEIVNLTFTVTHNDKECGGIKFINDNISYFDSEGHTVSFPNPPVTVRGCAAKLVLTPDSASNIVGTSHMVTAAVTDDFGIPVSGVTVNFEVTGGASIVDGDPSNPMPANGVGVTDSTGQVTFSYTNNEASIDTIKATVPLQDNVCHVLTQSVTKQWQPITAIIDIKPGSFPNSFGANSRGKIPVALLGSSAFDVTKVNDSTVRFGDAPSVIGDAAPVRGIGHLENVNSDGYQDKVYQFEFTETNLDPSDTQGCLGGEINGLDFLGCDSVNIVPNSNQ
ncbi:VWA domain-containing protein [Cytobacillus sp. FSL H8-0458]|uniref:VWA domain-containing protein n=1 Tax=Cytobacillus sp. FSL H8-0458 TaxID=2975346 RepID=UPI0030FAD993